MHKGSDTPLGVEKWLPEVERIPFDGSSVLRHLFWALKGALKRLKLHIFETTEVECDLDVLADIVQEIQPLEAITLANART
jgi:hypothetical protein